MSVVFDHCGFVVSSLDQAIQFFSDEFGADEIRRGEVADPTGDQMSQVFGVHSRATSRFVFLAFGEKQIELLEWAGPDRNDRVPGNADAGARHLALKVPDLAATLGRLGRLPGFQVRAQSPLGFHYMLTPFGLELQLFQAK